MDLILVPSNNQYEYEIAVENGVDQTITGVKNIPIEAWTRGGFPLKIR